RFVLTVADLAGSPGPKFSHRRTHLCPGRIVCLPRNGIEWPRRLTDLGRFQVPAITDRSDRPENEREPADAAATVPTELRARQPVLQRRRICGDGPVGNTPDGAERRRHDAYLARQHAARL